MANQIRTSKILREPRPGGPGESESLRPVAGEYRQPELLEIGRLDCIQGRNFYDDRDLGNANYFI